MLAGTPQTRLRRLLRIAHFDGISLIAAAGVASLGAAIGAEWRTAAIGVGVAGCGLLEMHGRRAIVRGKHRGVVCLCLSQLFCLALVLAYTWTLGRQDNADHILRLLPAFSRAQLAEVFPDPGQIRQLLSAAQRLIAAAVAIAAILYQGGMALYYLRARPMVRAALETPPLLPR